LGKNPESLLKEAHERNAQDIVFYLVEERKMIPTVEILKWIAEQDQLEVSRKRRRVDAIN
jgi:hypothetical protein